MKLPRAAAAATLPIPLLCMWMAPPAAAATTHTIVMTGTMTVVNGGGIGHGSSRGTFDIPKTEHVTHDKPVDTIVISKCVGDETVGELTVHLQLRRDEMVVASPTFRLFEGSSCLTRDLDGQAEAIQHGMKPGQSLTNWRLSARNGEALSDDSGSVTFNLKHNTGSGMGFGRPAEVSGVVATRVAGDPSKVLVQWEDVVTDETSFQIRNSTRNTTVSVGANSTSFILSGQPTERQCYQVRAANSHGTSDFTPVNPQGECI
ncbi:hypothetical protein [Streptomyces sp. NPDC051211]|uniref:hypothetical protein n=1 Tax=Streptomyces sp. NPDC051211 TaxID=3154643 RepID=UPI00344E358E